MKFAILSDSHNNQPNIKKALDYLNKNNIKILLHCGDFDTAEDLKMIAENFKGEIHMVYGNADYAKGIEKEAKKHSNVKDHDEIGKIEIDGMKIAINHYPMVAEELAQSGEYDLIFHGHTHTPSEKKFSSSAVRNPGTLAGINNKATFAIYDTVTKNPELILLEKI